MTMTDTRCFDHGPKPKADDFELGQVPEQPAFCREVFVCSESVLWESNKLVIH